MGVDSHRGSNRGRVLIVDDEEAVRELLSEVLVGEGFQVELASSAEQALTNLGKDDCDLVITDIRMSGMSGMELLLKVKALREDTEVVILSAYGDIPMSVRAIKQGADLFIPFRPIKPIAAPLRCKGWNTIPPIGETIDTSSMFVGQAVVFIRFIGGRRPVSVHFRNEREFVRQGEIPDGQVYIQLKTFSTH